MCNQKKKYMLFSKITARTSITVKNNIVLNMFFNKNLKMKNPLTVVSVRGSVRTGEGRVHACIENRICSQKVRWLFRAAFRRVLGASMSRLTVQS